MFSRKDTAVRPPAFLYKKTKNVSQLYCEGASLAQLAERFGTPLYVYSATALRARFKALDRAFRSVPHTMCYSVKANSNLSILRLLAKSGAGFDVVSGGELQRVLRVGKRFAKKTVFSGVGKTRDEMDAALHAGILLFNIESESELLFLAERAARWKKKAPVAFRVNPDVFAETHPYISTGLREHKFGVPIDDALRLYRTASNQPWLEVRGVSVHIGSQITSVQPFATAMGRVAELVRELASLGLGIRYVDAGGGLGIPYHHGEENLPRMAEAYAQAIIRPLHDLKVNLLLEPGRLIVGPAGALLTQTLYLKYNGEKRFAIVDAAMNDLLRPSLYNAYHEIMPALQPADGKASAAKFDIVGPICETGDFFARDRKMAELHEGDLLAILDAGAYGMSLASNYNSRTRPAEILVDGNKTRVIRKRETMDNMLATEL